MHQDFAGLRKRGAVIVVQCEAGSPLRPKRAALRAAQGFAPSLPRTGNLKHPWGILIVADEKERLTPNIWTTSPFGNGWETRFSQLRTKLHLQKRVWANAFTNPTGGQNSSIYVSSC